MNAPTLTPPPSPTTTPPAHRDWNVKTSFLVLLALALLVGALFLQPPGFGDDLTYWVHAFNLHRIGLEAWHENSFHDLRWPVWGVCWVLQGLTHFGPASYYGEPLLYLAAGAALSFALGRRITGSIRLAFACGVAFLFHPLLDSVAGRPMPDLSEAVWGAAILLAWWKLMEAKTTASSLLFAGLAGAGVFIIESNRITGVFIVPVLVAGTLLYFRPRFRWLLAAGAVAALLYGAECFFYHRLFGDWLHNIHANLGNKGAKGTGAIALWMLPIRFLSSLWDGSALAPFYCLLALAGSALVLESRFLKKIPAAAADLSPVAPGADARVLGRVIFLWFALLYLQYSCAPQGFKGGWNPLIRDADRFLCGMVVPMAILAVLGLTALWRFAQCQWPRLAPLARQPAILAALCLALLVAGSARNFFDLGFIPKMSRYMAARPAGTRIFTHDSMRAMAYLAAPRQAEKFVWDAPGAILNHKPELEASAAQAQEFWYIRKLVWLTTRKKLQKSGGFEQQPLGSYFEDPDRDWIMTQLLAKGDTPDLIFYRRRTDADAPPRILPSTDPIFGGLVPALPLNWKAADGKLKHFAWNIPAGLQGRFVRLELQASSAQVEGFTVTLRFLGPSKSRFLGRGNELAEYLLKPYLHPEPGKEFFAFEIPAGTQSCEVDLRLSKSAKTVTIHDLRAVVAEPPPL